MTDVQDIHSLYRRFRPQRFDEVIGQDHVTRALRNAVANHKVTHAYLFSGPRGTGKTSSARILAKALNCASPKDGEPCDRCESCVLVREGRSYDVEELDAASNSGVDAIRALISTVSTASYGTWKIYIIDEVHMLSTAASNALLKTLEEPPEHVVFVLATTLKQKVLQTIVSRTQHFEFKLLGDMDVKRLLRSVSERADLAVGQSELAWIQRRGGGSARDTLSYLDQVLALGGLPVEDVDHVVELSASVIRGDAAKVIGLVERLAQQGTDPSQIALDILRSVREAFLYSVAGISVDGPPPDLIRVLEDAGVDFSTSDFTKVMESLGKATLDLRDGIDPLVLLEALLVSISAPRSIPLNTQSAPAGHTAVFEDRMRLLEEEVRALRSELAELSRGRLPPQRRRDGALKPQNERQTESSQSSVLGDIRRGMSGGASVTQVSPESVVSASVVENRAQAAVDGLTRTFEVHATEPLKPEVGDVERDVVDAPGTRPAPNSLASRDDVSDDDDPNVAVLESSTSVMGGSGQSRTLPEVDEVFAQWNRSIKEQLPLIVRSLFQTARFLEVKEKVIVVAFELDIYLERTKPHRKLVSQAIGSHFGVDGVRLEVVVRPTTEPELPSKVSQDDRNDELMNDFISSDQNVEENPISEIVTRVFPGARPVE